MLPYFLFYPVPASHTAQQRILIFDVFIKKDLYAQSVIEEIETKQDKYGSENVGDGKKALIEHTSINPNASPHIGRARNALIGDSIVKLLKFNNYES